MVDIPSIIGYSIRKGYTLQKAFQGRRQYAF